MTTTCHNCGWKFSAQRIVCENCLEPINEVESQRRAANAKALNSLIARKFTRPMKRRPSGWLRNARKAGGEA